jgi:N-hydroxyarylamine O-acetyltransferase
VDITAYLDRINYHGPLAPTAETLRELQVAHLLTVPFENLSIHTKQPIVLDDNALFEKIVMRRRGGFCYEANGLFAALLRALEFDVKMLSAGAANAKGGCGDVARALRRHVNLTLSLLRSERRHRKNYKIELN